MECGRFEMLVQHYLDADLGAASAHRVEAHAAQCSTCGGLLEGYKLLFSVLDGLERHVAPPGFAASVLARLEARRPAPRAAAWRALAHPERALSGGAQIAVATSLLAVVLYVLDGSRYRLGTWGLHLLGEAATWVYSAASGVLEPHVGRLGAVEWSFVQQTAATLTNAARLIVQLHVDVVALSAVGTALALALPSLLRRSRISRGGPNASLHLV